MQHYLLQHAGGNVANTTITQIKPCFGVLNQND